jgi:hypothetical protein
LGSVGARLGFCAEFEELDDAVPFTSPKPLEFVRLETGVPTRPGICPGRPFCKPPLSYSAICCSDVYLVLPMICPAAFT